MQPITDATATGVTDINWDELIARAVNVRCNAYAPYSRFPVGAALLGESGQVYAACNVENGSYGLSICAERSAVFQAVAAGEQRFRAIAIVTQTGAAPCGACRQVLAEFDPAGTMTVALADLKGGYRLFSLADLLPHRFTSGQLSHEP
jgi:cytidine deaminase